MEREPDGAKVTSIGSPQVQDESLPYHIELWNDGGRAAVERILARAFSAALARAIFKAAQAEHPGRRITLCRGSRVIADSEKVDGGPSGA
jgi:hypothetical protein